MFNDVEDAIAHHVLFTKYTENPHFSKVLMDLWVVFRVNLVRVNTGKID
jgi:hypothetical protein